MKDLKPFGEEVVNSMKSAGFLKTGWTKEEETFGATEMLQKYVESVCGKPNLIERTILLLQNGLFRRVRTLLKHLNMPARQ